MNRSARRIDRSARTARTLELEELESRALPSAAAWAGYGHDAQHTGISANASQPIRSIRWQTPVDLSPQHNPPPNGDLLIHYGSPLLTSANTVLIPVKTGATDGFEITARNGDTGNLKYTVSTDYTISGVPFDWTPSYSPTLTPSGRLYYAGAGGTLNYIDNLDSNSSHTPVQVAFYGLSSYLGNCAAFKSSVYVDTPLTSDNQGDIFFGFRVVGKAPAPLNTTQSGYARIDPNGNGTYVLAGNASGDSAVSLDSHNLSPALSNDQTTVYVAVKSAGNEYHAYLLGLDSTTLATKYKVFLNDPRPQSGNTFNPAGVLDNSTSSPTVGPDGDVYFGVMGNPFNGSRGWLLHFNSNLTVKKTPGAFGWDDTVSIVPTSMVPSYQGTSSYLVFSKYNNYAGLDGGDGVNKIAILDPNATEVEPHPSSKGLLVMKEVMTVAGPTPDPTYRNQGFPNAVREWCINAAAVDPATKSILANSEDGKLYRWSLVTNTLSASVTLTPGIGEAYTPTVIGADGTIYAINNATLFAVGGFNSSTSVVASSLDPSMYGQTVTFSATVKSVPSTAVVPTGKVSFVEGGTTLGAGTVNGMGQAQFGISSLSVGDHLIRAFYSGDRNFTPSFSSSLFTQTVKPAATATVVQSSVNPSVFGQLVAFTATVHSTVPNSSPPTGTVTFDDNGAPIATRGLVNGMAQFKTSLLSAGNHMITAVYEGAKNYAGSTSSRLGQIVRRDGTHLTIISSLNPSAAGNLVSFTVTGFPLAPGSGSPTGTVTFFDGSVALNSTAFNLNRHAVFSTFTLSVGTHSISASYAGDANFFGSTSPTIQQVVKPQALAAMLGQPQDISAREVDPSREHPLSVSTGGPAPDGKRSATVPPIDVSAKDHFFAAAANGADTALFHLHGHKATPDQAWLQSPF